MLPDSVFQFVIMGLEGGAKVHDRGADADPGRLTKYGFAQTRNPDVDVANLTEAQAKVLADDRYWKKAKCYEFSPALALMHFDCAFNQGVETAAFVMQSAVGVKVDGSIGALTIKAANEWDQRALLKRYSKARKERWLRLNNSVEEANENGWMNRLIDVIFECHKLL